MIKPTTFILLIIGCIVAVLAINKSLDENQKLHQPQFKLIEEVKAIDTTQSMDMHPDDIKMLLNS